PVSQIRLSGVYTALVTPFQDSGAVDERAFVALVERQIAGGVSGLVPCGTTGESVTLSDDEWLRVVALTVETARKRVPVLAGTGTNDTAKTIRQTRRAREGGADAALARTPHYNQ